MTNDEIRRTMDKAAAAEQWQKATQGNAGKSQTPVRIGFRERVEDRKLRSERESQNADGLRELSYLLDKNPDVARILELLDCIPLGINTPVEL